MMLCDGVLVKKTVASAWHTLGFLSLVENSYHVLRTLKWPYGRGQEEKG